jgi:hypothetical protein
MDLRFFEAKIRDPLIVLQERDNYIDIKIYCTEASNIWGYDSTLLRPAKERIKP